MNHPRRRPVLLFAVTGMSPAIVTETIWGLALEDPDLIPDRIVVLTTLAGKTAIETELFEPNPAAGGASIWECLAEALDVRGWPVKGRLSMSDRVIFHQATGRRPPPLQDIRTREDNEAVADQILEHLRRFSENDDYRIVASIAGGRKSMGALLYGAMCLIGRPGDRLTHVLVDEPFEDPRLRPRFFFPDQPGGSLTHPDGRHCLASRARIDLADVPFVPLRGLFRKEFGRLPGGFRGLVDRYYHELESVSGPAISLAVHRSRRLVEIAGRPVKTGVREHALLWMLLDHEGDQGWSHLGDLETPFAETMKMLRNEAPQERWNDWRWDPLLTKSIDDGGVTITKTLSNLRRSFREVQPEGDVVAEGLPKRGRHRFDNTSMTIDRRP